MELDGPNNGGGGGSSLTIGGTLTNSSTNGNGVSIGNTGITSADTLTVNGTGGLSNTERDQHRRQRHRPGDPERRQRGGGVRHAGVETGTVYLANDALLEFESGQITTVDGEL